MAGLTTHRRTTSDGGGVPGARVGRTAAAAVILAALATACGTEEPRAEVVRIEAGSTVTVRGPVEDVYGPHSFTLAMEVFDEDALLVLSAEDNAVEEGDVVEVTGAVTAFDQDLIERELGVELQREERVSTVGFTERMALTAADIRPAPGTA